MAIKAFKSMKAGQDWGGAEQGMELSFQWAPYPEARESRERREFFVFVVWRGVPSGCAMMMMMMEIDMFMYVHMHDIHIHSQGAPA